MGVLTDFVVAGLDDAQAVCESACPSEEFSGLDAKGIDTVKLGKLHAMLTGSEFNPRFISGEPLASGGDDGPWVMQVPTDLVQRLSGLDASTLRDLSTKWAKTEEFSSYESWSPGAVEQVLLGFASLCSRAVDEDKAVLMWMCL